MKPPTERRALALDVHPRSFGYVVFEGPDHLLDWEIKSATHGGRTVKVSLAEKLNALLDEYRPDVVVVKSTAAARVGMMSTVAVAARSRRIPMKRLSPNSIAQAFPGNDDNKYKIATVIANRFPELAPRLGPRRKKWQPEK